MQLPLRLAWALSVHKSQVTLTATRDLAADTRGSPVGMALGLRSAKEEGDILDSNTRGYDSRVLKNMCMFFLEAPPRW